jgi:flagellar basal-body rod modification protein FlgD
MSVTSVTGSNAASTTGSTESSSIFNQQLDGNAFLKLFLTQLQYQDPTNPMESYEMASQLAQFSSVEKLANINTNLTALQTSLSTLTNAQMVGLIGKQVVAQANTLQVSGGTASNGQYQFELASGTAKVTITISDENGNAVRTKTIDAQAGGQYQLDWDGLDSSNNKVSDGTYTFAVDATDSSGNSLDVTNSVSGTAYSCRLEQGSPYLILDGPAGIKVPASSITEITAATAS